MEFLLGLVAVVGVVGFAGFALINARVTKMNETAAANSAGILRELFNGDAQVSHRRGLGGLTDEALLRGAAEHGYTLTTSHSDRGMSTMVFTRIGGAAPPAKTSTQSSKIRIQRHSSPSSRRRT